jgi:hypothetical protein
VFQNQVVDSPREWDFRPSEARAIQSLLSIIARELGPRACYDILGPGQVHVRTLGDERAPGTIVTVTYSAILLAHWPWAPALPWGKQWEYTDATRQEHV